MWLMVWEHSLINNIIIFVLLKKGNYDKLIMHEFAKNIYLHKLFKLECWVSWHYKVLNIVFMHIYLRYVYRAKDHKWQTVSINVCNITMLARVGLELFLGVLFSKTPCTVTFSKISLIYDLYPFVLSGLFLNNLILVQLC